MVWNNNPSVQENMSKKLVSVKETYSLESAHNLMLSNNFRHLAVTDENEKVVGIISDRDMQRAMRSNLNKQGDIKVEELSFDPKACVGDYMTWPIVTVHESTPLKTVVDKMLQAKVSALIVERELAPVGIITTQDLLRVLSSLLKDETPSAKMTLAEWLVNPALMSVTNTLSQAGI